MIILNAEERLEFAIAMKRPHNLLILGSVGCGKTMLLRYVPSKYLISVQNLKVPFCLNLILHN